MKCSRRLGLRLRMGVQGLCSFLETHQRIYRDVQFGRSRLVIDGCNLYHLLYFSSGLDQIHGGEYAAYESLIERFFTALRTCGISPYVLLDGASDVSDKKQDTVVKRSLDRVQRSHQAAVSNSQMDILPGLAHMVFRQTLARLGVPVAQCFEESDQEIAALASEWKCPVLSNDSDFYIFDLPGGFLPISHFQWKEVKQRGSQSSISCRRYYTSSFCIFFGIQQQLLPTFAALAGNDYVKLKFRWTQFSSAGMGPPSRLEGLLRWLKDFQHPQDALEAALGLMGELSKKSKKEFLHRLHQGMEAYQLSPSALSRFFLHQEPPELPAQEEDVSLVPRWMLLPFTQARLPAVILDILRLGQMTALGTSVDHKDLPSANLTSRSLRQVMYGLLLGKKKSLQVMEIDREGLQLTSIPVKPTFSRTGKRLRLSSLQEEEFSDRLQVLLEALGVTQDLLSLLPPLLKLPVAVTCYWLKTAQPPPDLVLLKALLLGISTGNMHRAGHSCNQQLDRNVSHSFNQWQVSLRDSIWLNALLGFPLPEPPISLLYQGMLVHQLVHRMKTGARLKALLKSNRTSVNLYHTMLSIIHQFQAQQALVTSRNWQKTRIQQQPLETLNDLTASLQQLFHSDDETEREVDIMIQTRAELQLGEQMLVRTRYRTKDRSNRCNKPEMARKQECRGWDLF